MGTLGRKNLLEALFQLPGNLFCIPGLLMVGTEDAIRDYSDLHENETVCSVDSWIAQSFD